MANRSGESFGQEQKSGSSESVSGLMQAASSNRRRGCEARQHLKLSVFGRSRLCEILLTTLSYLYVVLMSMR